jgi:FkbM family methyltransferase
MLFSILRLRWTLATGICLQVLSRTDWTLYNDIFVDGEYDEAIQALMRLLEVRDKVLVVDLGANVGFFDLRIFHRLCLAGISAKKINVIAVEPSPTNIQDLGRRILLQGEWAGCLTIVPGLVGEKRSGTVLLFESHNYGSNTLIEALRAPGARRIAVDFVDLDELLPEGEPIHLLKCDIEGAELEFVRNYSDLLRRIQIAIFEVHHQVCDVEQIRRGLESAGLSHERIIVDRGDTSIRLYTREPSQSR